MFTSEQDLEVEKALRGESIYGDDFDAEQVDAWVAAEERAYYELSAHRARESADSAYAYHALNYRHGYSHLPERKWRSVLGLGSAKGCEMLPILDRVEQLTIVEAADEFHADRIGDRPARYVRPRRDGRLPFEGAEFDLVIGLGVLHHIPNVTTVLGELSRCLRPGGYALLREPIVSMGDWRRPRQGLSQRERGIPLHLFRSAIHHVGLEVIRERKCVFSLTQRLGRVVTQGKRAFNSSMLVAMDDLLCQLPVWPDRYHAERVWQKFRPTSVYYVLRKPESLSDAVQ